MAGYTRTAGPGAEPVTLAEVKAHAVIGTDVDDTLLGRLIKVARAEAESATGRTFITSTWVRTLDSFPDAIQLLRGPVVSITSVKFDDENGDEQTLASSDYTLDTNGGMLAYVVPAYGKAWPATRQQINAVRVTFVAGFGADETAVPEDLRHWIAMRVATLYENREMTVVGNGLSMVSVPFADALLDVHKLPVI